jgi:N-methylhydantoinase B
MDVIRRYGVVMDYTTNQVLIKSTEQYREAMLKRTLEYWD